MSTKSQSLRNFLKKRGLKDQQIISHIFNKYEIKEKQEIILNDEDYNTILYYLNEHLKPHYTHTKIVSFKCITTEKFLGEININLIQEIELINNSTLAR